MTQVFILQNQELYLYSKQGEWVDGRDAKILFRTEHKDEAVNQCVEITAKDYTQRVQVVQCDLNDKGNPQLAAEQLPPPLEPSTPEIALEPEQLEVTSGQASDDQPNQGHEPSDNLIHATVEANSELEDAADLLTPP